MVSKNVVLALTSNFK